MLKRTPSTVTQMAGALMLLAAAVGCFPRGAAAQALEVKRTLPVPQDECAAPAAAAAAAATRPDAARARVLVSEAQQSILGGDRTAALTLLAEAARLDPRDAEIAYIHGRTLEEAGAAAEARVEFCRFLVLAPRSPDAAEVRERLAAIPSPPVRTFTAAVAEQFRNGVVFLDREEFPAAVRAFSYAIQHQPDLAEAYFNRGVAHLALRRRDLAVRDLEAYLSLAPSAPDRAVVVAQMQAPAAPVAARPTPPVATPAAAATRPAAAPPSVSPVGVLLGGMVVPGLGQFATRRPALGALFTIGAGASIGLALQSREVERTAIFLDPFNNPWEYTVRGQEHPYRTGGIVAAGAITLLGAAEAYLHARQRAGRASAGATSSAVVPIVAAEADGGFSAGLSLPLPSPSRRR